MAVGFEVDTNVQFLGSMVEMLDSGGRAVYFEFEVLLDVLGSSTIGIRSLYDSDLKRVSEAGLAHLVTQKGGDKGGDAVSVEETEDVA